jgi:hypothetical protein
MDQFTSHPLYRKHDLDSVTSSLWSFYIKNFLVLFIASFVANAGIQYMSASIDISKITSLTDPYEMFAVMKTWIWPFIGVFAITIVLTVVLQYFILYKNEENSVNIFTSVYKSLKYLVPYIIIMFFFIIFASFAMVAGLIVFIIGALFSALYVFMIGLFILPVLMAEGNNIGHTINRTFKLSHRHFGPNIGYTAIFVVILIVGSLILSSLVLFPFTGSFLKLLSNPEDAAEAMSFMQNPWYIILSAVANSIFTPLGPIFAAILYFNGRAREEETNVPVKENNGPDRVRVEDLYSKPYSDDHPDNPERR